MCRPKVLHRTFLVRKKNLYNYKNQIVPFDQTQLHEDTRLIPVDVLVVEFVAANVHNHHQCDGHFLEGGLDALF